MRIQKAPEQIVRELFIIVCLIPTEHALYGRGIKRVRKKCGKN